MSSEIVAHPYGRNVGPNERCKRHVFSKEIRKQVAPYRKSNNYSGVIRLCEDWIVIFLSILISLLSLNNINNKFILLFIHFILLQIIGSRQVSLGIKLHAASHGALAKNQYLNYVLGTFFSGYTTFRSMSVYRKSHVKFHHQYLGNPHKDPDYKQAINNKLCGKYRSSLNTLKYLLSISISPIHSINYMKYIISEMIYNKNEKNKEIIIRTIYYLFILIFLYYKQWIIYFIFYWIIPYFTSHIWIQELIELLEHYPEIDNNKIEFKDLYISKNRIWNNIFTNFMFSIHGEGYHLVHHLYPIIPAWHLKKVHNILMNDDKYKQLNHNHKGLIDMIKKIITNSDN